LQEPAAIERQMRSALAANGGSNLLWWQMVDHGVPDEHVELVHHVWREVESGA
jgi:hypothetical protein